MEIKDFLDISDSSINGLVIIRDKNGKILVKKHNMILKYGKIALLARFLHNFGDSNQTTLVPFLNLNGENEKRLLGKYINYTLNKAIFYNEPSEVRYTDNVSADVDLGEELTKLSNLTDLKSSLTDENRLDFILNDSSEISLELVDHHIAMSFKFNVSFDNNLNVTGFDKRELNSLSLVMKDTNNDDYELFSRIRFDPIILTPESTLTVQYYVYF